MLAALLFSHVFAELIAKKAVFVFVDNNGVLGSPIKGGPKAPEANLLAGRPWPHAAEWAWVPFGARVESTASIADGPSRHELGLVRLLGATWVEPSLPAELESLRLLDVDCLAA